MAPWDIKFAIEKAVAAGNGSIVITERGASFGYNNLVSDMRSLAVLGEMGYPVVFDATHSVQLPGGRGKSSGVRAGSYPSWHVPQWPLVATASSLRSTKNRHAPCATALTLWP
jgi:3-deoxy-D-manno-octulosonic acid (KDO) 8-phosphate synthase